MINLFGCAHFFNVVSFFLYPTEVKMFKSAMLETIAVHVFLSLKVIFIIPNSADPDETQYYAAFYLGLHCLPKYQSCGFQYKYA